MDVPDPPGAKVSVLGEAVMVKSGPEIIVRVIGVEWLIEPAVPTTSIV